MPEADGSDALREAGGEEGESANVKDFLSTPTPAATAGSKSSTPSSIIPRQERGEIRVSRASEHPDKGGEASLSSATTTTTAKDGIVSVKTGAIDDDDGLGKAAGRSGDCGVAKCPPM